MAQDAALAAQDLILVSHQAAGPDGPDGPTA